LNPDTPDIPDNAKEAVLAQARLIAERLRNEAGMSFGTRTPAQITWVMSLVTGELVVALSVGEFTYHEANSELIRQREQRGRTAYSTLSLDRGWSPWTEMAPPPSRAAGN
jgi:hypothetical protein